jgi:hypothetical protein
MISNENNVSPFNLYVVLLSFPYPEAEGRLCYLTKHFSTSTPPLGAGWDLLY